MNSFRHLFLPALVVLLLGTALWGCRKERSADELSPQEEVQIALASVRGDAQAGFQADDMFDNAMGASPEVGVGNTGVFGRVLRVDSAPTCLRVIVQRLNPPQPFPVRFTLDFGTAGCAGRDGRVRTGKVIFDYTARLTEPGALVTTSFDNYRVDSSAVSGTLQIRNTSVPGGPRSWTITTNDARIDKPSGNYIRWSGTRSMNQVEGMATPGALDDVFLVTGGASGVLQAGNLISTWSSNIEQPLRKRFACRWFVSGTIRTTRGNLSASSPYAGLLDYGQGNCDNVATLTLNNSTYQISLP